MLHPPTAGGTGVAAGVSLSATGEGALVGVPLAVVSAPVAVHGGATATEGAAHLGAAAADAINDAIHSPTEKSTPKEGSAGGPGAGKRATPEQRQGALQENNGKCVFCGDKATQADHAVPRSRNGNNTKKNLQGTCAHCNNQKNNKTTREYLKWKKKQPQQ
ncbi:MAG: HNH endonuclease [Candidatus Acidiferrum sp.]